MSRTYHIALGSNLGDRLAHLRAGVSAMDALADTCVVAVAPLYETDPVDCPPGSQAFYNSVAAVESSLAPEVLLRHLRDIEARLGRPNEHDRHAPRTLDLDILCAGDLVVESETLVLPHPRMHLRLFVLQPLAELVPDLVLPGRAESVRSLLEGLQSEEVPLRLVAAEWFTI